MEATALSTLTPEVARAPIGAVATPDAESVAVLSVSDTPDDCLPSPRADSRLGASELLHAVSVIAIKTPRTDRARYAPPKRRRRKMVCMCQVVRKPAGCTLYIAAACAAAHYRAPRPHRIFTNNSTADDNRRGSLVHREMTALLTSDVALLYTAAGRALLLMGVFLLVGAAAATWLAPMRRIVGVMRASALLLMAGVALQVVGQLANFDAFVPDAEPLRDLLSIIATTAWAKARVAVLMLAVVTLAATLLSAFTNVRQLDAIARLCAATSLLLLPLLGHAASAEPAWIALPLAAAHATAASVWLGTLVVLGPAWWHDVQAILPLVPRYGRVALFAAPLTVLSGAATAYTRLESPADLLGATYGQLLLAKSVLVLIILTLGARHHRSLVRARDQLLTNLPTMRRTLQLEVALAIVLFTLTGVLGESAPPRLD